MHFSIDINVNFKMSQLKKGENSLLIRIFKKSTGESYFLSI